MNTFIDGVVVALMIGGALLVLSSAVAMLRERDALSRINVLSPATGMGVPLIVLAAYINSVTRFGFDPMAAAKLLVTLGALLVVSSVASNILARSTYLSGAAVDERTNPNELANDPANEPAKGPK